VADKVERQGKGKGTAGEGGQKEGGKKGQKSRVAWMLGEGGPRGRASRNARAKGKLQKRLRDADTQALG